VPPMYNVAPDVTGTIHALGTQSTDSGPLAAIDDPADGVAPGTHVLMVVRGPATGSRIDLVGDRMTVGRSAETDIFLEDITVSREHANFERDGDGWVLVDLGSLNGTYVGRQRVDRVALVRGDEIQIGKYRFRYYNGETTGAL
jgi:pSer/pThr/pTyr-binding forkhead associated (FHA) protein